MIGRCRRWRGRAAPPARCRTVNFSITLAPRLTSTKCPAIAAAAAIAGLTRWVRPPGALPALEVAIRGRGAALARLEPVGVHAEAHRAARLAPLEAGVAGRPGRGLRFSACAFTSPEPGTTIASLTFEPRACPRTTAAAARRSSMRELVHEPMNTLSMRDVGDRRVAARGPCRRARAPCLRAGPDPFPGRGRARASSTGTHHLRRRAPGDLRLDLARVERHHAVELRVRRRCAACASRRRPGPSRRPSARTAGP